MTTVDTILNRAFAPLAGSIEAGRIPGGVLGVIDRDGHRAVRALGSAQIAPPETAPWPNSCGVERASKIRFS